MVADGSAPSTTHAPHCCCPACLGLQPFQRPVFAPGQVLTDIDLSADQDTPSPRTSSTTAICMAGA